MVALGFLGPLEVDGARTSLSPRDRTVLSALAVHASTLAPDQVAAAVWGDEPPGTWPKQVQTCVMRLRRVLGAEAIETTSGGYRLALTGDDLDVRRFEGLVERGRALAAQGEVDRAASTLARALDLWRGEPFGDLDGWSPGRSEAARLAELRRNAQEDLQDARLAAGEHRVVATEAEVMVAEEPLRERRWAILALAQYRSGRQADALRSLHQARRTLADQLGIDPGPELVALEAAILRQDRSLAVVAEPPVVADDCPYKGLAAYDESDVDGFFGRDADVAACLARLETSRLLAVAGPSGCGKSSLVRAGLVPALRARQRAVAVVVPGPDPAAALAGELAGGDRSAPVLVVDQFEDLFTLGAPAATVAELCARLVRHAEEVAPVVLVVRSDHLAGLAAEPALARLVEQGLYLTGPLRGDTLRAAIEGPAQQAGLRLEPGLVDLLVRDTEDEPGALPLLSHALVETWRRRDGRVLTVEGYRATGGIRGAVARSADRLYESLPPDQRSVLRSLLLQLVAPVPDGEPVRSRVASRALGGDPARQRVLGLLVRARLVTAEEETVELAHEALARAWPRLRSWLDDDAAGQRILRHLAATADGWEALGRPGGELYRGARLDAALEWREAAHPDLTPVEAAFLDASAAAATAERQAEAARAGQQARQNRRLRALLAGTALLLVVALAAGLVAVRRTGDAREQRDVAQAAQQDAQLEALVNRSLALRPTNRGAAALLAVEAYRRRPDARAWSALLGTFQSAPGFLGYRYLPADFYVSGALVPGTATAVVALDGRDLRLLDLDSGEMDDPFPPAAEELPATVPVTRVSGDGRLVAQFHNVNSPDPCFDLALVEATDGRGCAALTVHALDSGRLVLGPVTPPFSVGDVALNHDGSVVAVSGGFDGDVALYRTADGRLVGTLPGVPRPDGAGTVERTAALAFAPDGRLVVGSMAGPVRLVDPATAQVVARFDAPRLSTNVRLVVLPSGVALAAGDTTLVALDLSTGATRWTTDGRTGSDFEPCIGLAVAEAAGHFYCGSGDSGVIEERDLATGLPTGVRRETQLGGLSDLAISDDGRDLVVFGTAVSRWRVDGSGPVTAHVAEGQVVMDGFDPAGERLLVAGRGELSVDGAGPGGFRLPDFAVWDAATDTVVDPLDEDLYAAVWAGPELLGVVHADGSSGLYDVAARRRVDPGDVAAARVPVSRAWLSAGGTRFYVSHVTERGCEITTVDPAARAQVEPTITLDDCFYVRSLSATPGGERVAVTAHIFPDAAPARGFDRVTTVHDGTTGEPVAEPLLGLSEVGVSDDLLVGSDADGDLTVYDLATLHPEGELPGGRGRARALTFSADGTLLLAASVDGTVSLYDVGSRTRIGEPFPARIPNPDLVPGFLRPDGRAVAVTGRDAVAVWDLDPDRLADAACGLAGRNLTRTEWDTFLGGVGEYRATCPELPPDDGA